MDPYGSFFFFFDLVSSWYLPTLEAYVPFVLMHISLGDFGANHPTKVRVKPQNPENTYKITYQKDHHINKKNQTSVFMRWDCSLPIALILIN